GAGNDSMTGGAGNDVYVLRAAGAAEIDTVIELLGGGTDRLDFSALAATAPVTANLTSDATLATHANRTVKTGGAGQAANFENVTAGERQGGKDGKAPEDGRAWRGSNGPLAGGGGDPPRA